MITVALTFDNAKTMRTTTSQTWGFPERKLLAVVDCGCQLRGTQLVNVNDVKYRTANRFFRDVTQWHAAIASSSFNVREPSYEHAFLPTITPPSRDRGMPVRCAM
jgi:hypothetical protein